MNTYVRIFHKVVIILSPANREANAKGFVMLRNTYSEKAPMENRHFFYPSLLYSFIVMLKESVSYEIFSRSLPAKNKQEIYIYLNNSTWSDFEN